MFGYPLISYHKNVENYDRVTYLWNQIAKPILSVSTKRCIMKDIIDSHNSTDKIQKYVMNSFTSGKKIKFKTLNKFFNPEYTMRDEDFNPISKIESQVQEPQSKKAKKRRKSLKNQKTNIERSNSKVTSLDKSSVKQINFNSKKLILPANISRQPPNLCKTNILINSESRRLVELSKRKAKRHILCVRDKRSKTKVINYEAVQEP